ncbi:MAG TPA: pyridoxal phosphate-dependent aminotransferase [Deltaproteobacteria bacterium]|nr:pyridoxal phosphate-dependent aminotransferase [Deltaproteobacteria bacterium]HRW80531.1 pyridoxal phosphate-dependent aminotransferase [Desulfomonilia bacterium]HOC75653.1 pyridoxal phosphate-dependent aminotransferase [Deltaproteobacteria bacterium]HOY74789.1 pyridoxal phosphate-dependent aminotransferase [Deltaproteobacteria bacterium]HPA75289.1 pyridoxal phosphate-dependent aminotransferase [Deltaproteobacteria bacterium]
MDPSRTAQAVQPFLVMDVMEKANTLAACGRDIIHLEVGEPDFDTPECVREASIAAMQRGRTHYTDSLGIPELRQAIAEHYARTYGVGVDEDCIVVTAGSSPALLMAIACLVDAGDEVMMTDPYYACYPNFVKVLGARPLLIPTGSADGFQLDPSKVSGRISKTTRALIINSPANPTGVCLDVSHMKALADLSVPIISDEIYHGLVYESGQHTMLEFTDNAIVINGFSKAYAMTGWRLGWAIFPKTLIRSAQKLQQNLMICAPSIAQWGGVAALREAGPDVADMHRTFTRRRKIMLAEMTRHGYNVEVEPTGAFYVLVNMRRYTMDSRSFAMEILDRTGVGVTPGIDFGPGAEGYIRFSYANSEQNIVEGISRVAGHLKTL